MAIPMLFNGRNRVTQAYSWDGKQGHGGIDIVGDDDTNVLCVAEGKVVLTNRWDGATKTGTQSYGNLVVVRDSKGRRHYYAHLQSFALSVGDYIYAGEKIGIMGNTGNSFGAHTHYEVRLGEGRSTRINPTLFIGVKNKKGTYESSNTEEVIRYVIPNEDLNIRSGPSVAFSIIKEDGAKQNKKYGIVSEMKTGTQMWGELEKGKGWICLAYCRNEGEAPQHSGTAYTIICDWLKVRKSKHIGNNVVGKIYRGDVFYVISKKGNWCQLESGNWVCAGKWLKRI